MHRRKSSKDNDVEQENVLVALAPTAPSKNETSLLNGEKGENGYAELPLKSRENLASPVNSEYSPARTPLSAGPHRTSFGSLAHSPNSPLRKSYTHSRTMSSSGTLSFASPMHSPPLSTSFPRHTNMQGLQPQKLQASASESAAYSSPPPVQPSSPTTSRRHQRIHSRNLSVFFPRPGSLSATVIAEDGDGSQEVEFPAISLNEKEVPVTLIPPGPSLRLHNPPGPRKLGEGFTFGGRPERTISTESTGSSSDGANGEIMEAAPTRTKRRGHHHKHSMSHNFFSFLEPGSNVSPVTPSPEQKWQPMSPFPSSVASTFSQAHHENGAAVGLTSPNVDSVGVSQSGLPRDTIAVALVQFLLGATLWVSGQQHGSLACTGLGYWVVFDSFGVALRHVLPSYLRSSSMQSLLRRSYGYGAACSLSIIYLTAFCI